MSKEVGDVLAESLTKALWWCLHHDRSQEVICAIPDRVEEVAWDCASAVQQALTEATDDARL